MYVCRHRACVKELLILCGKRMENDCCCIPQTQNGLLHSLCWKQKAPGLQGEADNLSLNYTCTHMHTHIHTTIRPLLKLTGLSWLCLLRSGALPTIDVLSVLFQRLAHSSFLIWLACFQWELYIISQRVVKKNHDICFLI